MNYESGALREAGVELGLVGGGWDWNKVES